MIVLICVLCVSTVAQYRTAFKLPSAQISLLHLISIVGTHPELRSVIREHMFVSERGRSGSSIFSDRGMENANNQQKERNLTTNVFDSLLFTKFLQPMMHVYRIWKATFVTEDPIDIGLRSTIHNEVDAIVRCLVSKIGTTDLTQYSDGNDFWHTGNPVHMRSAANMQEYRPWEWERKVGQGLSRGLNMLSREHWWTFTLRHIRDHMFFQ